MSEFTADMCARRMRADGKSMVFAMHVLVSMYRMQVNDAVALWLRVCEEPTQPQELSA